MGGLEAMGYKRRAHFVLRFASTLQSLSDALARISQGARVTRPRVKRQAPPARLARQRTPDHSGKTGLYRQD